MNKKTKSCIYALALARKKKPFCIMFRDKSRYIFSYEKESSEWKMHVRASLPAATWITFIEDHNIGIWIYSYIMKKEGRLISSCRHFSVNIFDIIKVKKRIEEENRNHLKSIFFNKI